MNQGTKLKYVTDPQSQFKSSWEKSQYMPRLRNPLLQLNTTIVNNPWDSIRQKEEAVLRKHIPGIFMGSNFRYKNKREVNDLLRTQRLIQSKKAFDNLNDYYNLRKNIFDK
jgi:hypothetical protein